MPPSCCTWLRFLSVAAAVLLGLGSRSVSDPFDHSHARLAVVLEAAVDQGLVDYRGLREAPEALDAYLASLLRVTPSDHGRWTRQQRFAFWVNAYNAFTLQLVRDEGPVDSIKKIGGWFRSPWKRRFIPLGAFDPLGKGRELCLDDIEHRILRPRFNDARVHAAVNCASLGCPPLRAEPYRASELEEQLGAQVRAWLLDAGRNDLREVKGAVRVSKIFDWFEEDFGGSDELVVRWIAGQLGEAEVAGALREAAPRLRVRYLDYDWSLNAQAGRR